MTGVRAGALTVAILVLVAVAALIVGEAGTGVTDPDVGRPGADGVLRVDLEGYSFRPPELVLPVEQPIELAFTNRGDVQHHVSVGRSVIERDGQQVGFEQDLFAGLTPEVEPASAQVGPSATFDTFVVVARPGETVSVSVNLSQDRVGEWQVACFTAGGCHYRAGLSGAVTVE